MVAHSVQGTSLTLYLDYSLTFTPCMHYISVNLPILHIWENKRQTSTAYMFTSVNLNFKMFLWSESKSFSSFYNGFYIHALNAKIHRLWETPGTRRNTELVHIGQQMHLFITSACRRAPIQPRFCSDTRTQELHTQRWFVLLSTFTGDC